MPFGLYNAPATFERVMEQILRELFYKVCLVYLDNIIIFEKNFEEMLLNCRKIFLQLKGVNPKKCVFFSKEIKYLDHVISAEEITTDPKKINAVRDWTIS